MKRKKSNLRNDEIMVFPLNLPQRTALWIVLDLLYFTSEMSNTLSAAPICKKLQELDGNDQFIDLELGTADTKLAAHALDLAVQFLDGLNPYCDVTYPAFIRLATELREHNPVVRNLRHRFREYF